MTWSIIARDPSGAFGVAVASKFFAVGAICPHGEGGVGAGGIAGMPVDADIAGHLVGDDRRPRRPGRLARRDGGQRLVVDIDPFERVLRRGLVAGDDDGHGLAHVVHLVDGDARVARIHDV